MMNDWDPYDVLMQNTNHIEQLAHAQNNHAKIVQEAVAQQREIMTALIKLNTEFQQASHRLDRLERQYEIINPPTDHSTGSQ